MATLLNDILSRLEGVRKGGKKTMARCPAHDDSDPSLMVTEGDEVPVTLHCFAGCSHDEIARALGYQSYAHLCSEGLRDCPFCGARASLTLDTDEGDTGLWYCYDCTDGGSGAEYYAEKHEVPLREAIDEMQRICERGDVLPETSRKAMEAQKYLPQEESATDRVLEIERAKEKMTPEELARFKALTSMLRASYALKDAGSAHTGRLCDCGCAWWADSDPKRAFRGDLWKGIPISSPRRVRMHGLVYEDDQRRLKNMADDLVDRAIGRMPEADDLDDLF